jgi:glutathione S-transferase
MKLYASPGACSLAPHIALHELDLQHELVIVDLSKGDNQKPEFLALNPSGAVPVLEVDEGQFLTENQAILTYLGDLKPGDGLTPLPGDPLRYKLYQWLSFVATELHKGVATGMFASRFVSDTQAAEELAKNSLAKVEKRFALVSEHLGAHDWLLPRFSVADIYLFIPLNWWVEKLGRNLGTWPNLQKHHERMTGRLAVQKALAAEREAAKR